MKLARPILSSLWQREPGFSLKSLEGEFIYALDGYTIQGPVAPHLTVVGVWMAVSC